MTDSASTAGPSPSDPRSRRGVALDDADRQIIELLTHDGRTGNRALAQRVGLSEATVAARIRALCERRVLGVTAVFDWAAAGYGWDLWLGLRVQDRSIAAVAADLAQIPAVQSAHVVFGSVDIVAHALLADRAAAQRFLAHELAAVRGVRRASTDVTLETRKYAVSFARVPAGPSVLDLPDPVVELDGVDHGVIDQLVADGRRSNREVARRLGVSEGTVRARLRRMEDAGLLRICAQTDPYLTGQIGAWAYVGIEVDGPTVDEVAAKLATMPEVLIVACTSGRHDLLVLAVAPSHRWLVDTIVDAIRGLDGVRATETWDVVRTIEHDYHWARLV